MTLRLKSRLIAFGVLLMAVLGFILYRIGITTEMRRMEASAQAAEELKWVSARTIEERRARYEARTKEITENIAKMDVEKVKKAWKEAFGA